MPKLISTLPLAALALALPAAAQAQDYSGLPPLAPMAEGEVRQLPVEYRTAPTPAPMQVSETTTIVDGVETITRTRFIPAPAAPQGHAMPAPSYAPVVFERQQWLDECRRRTKGRDKDDTGTIILGLLGAVAGGIAGYEIAGVGDRVLGTVLGVGGGGLLGGLIGSLFDGDDDEDRYDCEAAIDNYLTQYGTPGTHIAAREIGYAPYPMSYGYPATYGYYAPPPQMVMVQVRRDVPQQVVVRETVREERYTVPGAARIIPAPRPTGKLQRSDR
jgi:hypothetical protein